MDVLYCDALPSAVARKGMIRLALRVSDIDGGEGAACDIAMSPSIACHVIMALTDAVAQHNGAKACNVYAFNPRKRRTRRKRRSFNPEPA